MREKKGNSLKIRNCQMRELHNNKTDEQQKKKINDYECESVVVKMEDGDWFEEVF